MKENIDKRDAMQNLNELLNYIPGFRTRKKRNMIIAFIYFIFVLFLFSESVGLFLFFLAAPFYVMGLISLYKLRKNKSDLKPTIYIVLSAMLCLVLGLLINPSSPTEEPTFRAVAVDEHNVENDNEPLIPSANAPTNNAVAIAFADDNNNVVFHYVPSIVYSTTAEENGLDGTFMHFSGVVTSFEVFDDVEFVVTQTNDGMIALVLPRDVFDINVSAGLLDSTLELDLLEIGQEFDFFFMYMGFSEVLEMPSGMFVGLNSDSNYPDNVYAPEPTQEQALASAFEDYLTPIVLGLNNVYVFESNSGISVNVSLDPPENVSSHKNISVLATIFVLDYVEHNDLYFSQLTVILNGNDGEAMRVWRTSTSDQYYGVFLDFVTDGMSMIFSLEDMLEFEPETMSVLEPETTPDLEPEATPEPEIAYIPEPETMPDPEPETAYIPEPETMPVSEPEITPISEPETAPISEPETAYIPESETVSPETAPQPTPFQRTVHWVSSGEVYHIRRNCPSLSNANYVHSGAYPPSGRRRCRRC